MKKSYIFSFLSMLFLAASLSAQKISPAIVAGVNFQNLNGKLESGDKLDNNMIAGYHAGVNILIPVAPEIYFQPGLMFSVKGSSLQYIPDPVKIRISYLELPLNLVYRGQLGSNFILLGFGPYVGYALAGKMISGNNKDDLVFTSTIEQGELITGAFRRFDAGAGIYAGYELSGGIFIQLDTQLGLINIKPENKNISNDKSIFKNTGFGLSLGYRF